MTARTSPQRAQRRWRCGFIALAAALALTGCSGDDADDDITVPPFTPTGHLAGARLPTRVAGYSVLGSFPDFGQLEATYALDSDQLTIAVVTLSIDPETLAIALADDQWYQVSRCGVFSNAVDPMQAACITPLADGALTVVGTLQTPAELAVLANAIQAQLPA